MATPSVSATPVTSGLVAFFYPQPWVFNQIARIDKTTTLNSQEYPRQEVERMQDFFSKYFRTCIYQPEIRLDRQPKARLGIYLEPSSTFTLIPAVKRDENLGPIDYTQVIQISPKSVEFVEAKEAKSASEIRFAEFKGVNAYLETITKATHEATRTPDERTQTMKDTWQKILNLFPKQSALQLKNKVVFPKIEFYEPKTKQYLLVLWDQNESTHRMKGNIVFISQQAMDQLTYLHQEQEHEHDQDVMDHHFTNIASQETLERALPLTQGALNPTRSDTIAPTPISAGTLTPPTTATSAFRIRFVE